LASIEIREASPQDVPAVLRLLALSLGWESDSRHATLFHWKHEHNPFGRSPAWVAVDGGEVIGYRAFLRWRFSRGPDRVDAVRAVDTATDPRARRRGVFRMLTLHAVERLAADDVKFVFNTPNRQSAPGYLSMGWRSVGRLPVNVRATSLAAWAKLPAARRPADFWSVPTSAGQPAADVLADGSVVAALLASQPASNGLRTDRSVDYLRWRYADAPFGYRILLRGHSVEDGFAVFRLRRRGRSLEAAICEVLVPEGDPRLLAGLTRRALAASGADHDLVVGRPRPRGHVLVPGAGPLLTWRALADDTFPGADQWDLRTGDVELF